MHLKLNLGIPFVCFISRNIQLLGCWQGDREQQSHSIRVFLEINNRGKRVKEVESICKGDNPFYYERQPQDLSGKQESGEDGGGDGWKVRMDFRTLKRWLLKR
jgi:hypothetical protein